MKAVILSVRPQWCKKICNGEKTIEVRKSAPKEVPFKAYIYATRPKKYYKCGAVSTSDELLWLANGKVEMGDGFKFWADGDEYHCLNGRIIGEFICRGIMQPFDSLRLMAKESCLTQEDLLTYSNGKPLYGWRIADLKIYDKPKELSEFKTPPCEKSEKACGNCKWLVKINTPDVYEYECHVEDGRPITRPPQSYMFVEEVEEQNNNDN